MQAEPQQMTRVRQVTEVRAAWTSKQPGQPGTYMFQLILDNGADEYIISTTPDDADTLLRMLERAGHMTFDTESKLLKFGTLTVGG